MTRFAALSWVFLVLAACNARAALPSMTDTPITVTTDHYGTFTLYRDYDNEKILYVYPTAIRIDLDADKKPMCRVALISETVDPKEKKVNSGGWIFIQGRVGYNDFDKVIAEIKTWLQTNEPSYAQHKLTSLAFRPDTASLTVEVAKNPLIPSSDLANPVTAPAGVNTSIGGVVYAMVPISTVHGEYIRQTVLRGKGVGADLGISLKYQATALFGVRPAKVKVTVKKDEVFEYFQQKSSGKAGFWIFSYNDERTKIREEFRSKTWIKTEIDFGDPALNADKGLLDKVAEQYENQLIDRILNLEVDRSTQTPNATPTVRTGQLTLFGSRSFWSFSSYLGGAYGVTDIKRHLEAFAVREFEMKKSLERNIILQSDGKFTLTKDMITTVDLDKSFEKVELVTCSNLQNADTLMGKYIDSIRVEAKLPNGDTPNWTFDSNTMSEQFQVYKRNAELVRKVEKIDGEETVNYQMELAPMQIKATLLGKGYSVEAPLRAVTRSPDRFEDGRIGASMFFDSCVIDASDLIAVLVEKKLDFAAIKGRLFVANAGVFREFSLRPKEPATYQFFARGVGFGKGSYVQFKLFDAINDYDWGDKVELNSEPTDKLDVIGSKVGGLKLGKGGKD